MTVAQSDCHGQHQSFFKLRRCVASDIERYLTKSAENRKLGRSLKYRVSAFLRPELLCLFIYRIAHYLWANNWKTVAAIVAKLNFLLHKVCLPASSCIGPGIRLSHPAGVVFRGSAGSGLTLFGMAMCIEQIGDTDSADCLTLGDDVTIGAHAVIIGRLQVGDRAKVAPFSSVRTDVKTDSTVVSAAMHTKLTSNRRSNT